MINKIKPIIINGDCLKPEIFHQIPYVDVIFTSPPYYDGDGNHDSFSEKGKKYNIDLKIDNYENFITDFLNIYLDKCDFLYLNIQENSKNKIDLINILYKFQKSYLQTIVWIKNTGIPSSDSYTNLKENIYIFSKKFKSPNIILNTNKVPKNIIYAPIHKIGNDVNHRAVMAPGVVVEISKIFNEKVKTILDPFHGLGTTFFYWQTKLDAYYGIELNKQYIDYFQKQYNFKERTLF